MHHHAYLWTGPKARFGAPPSGRTTRSTESICRVNIGRVAGKAEQLLRLMERRGFSLTEETRQRVTTCSDMPLLDLWFDRAIDATTLDEIFAAPSSTDRVPAPAQSPEHTAVPSQGLTDPESSAN
ncbi:hypothetical protein GCM10010287_00780 [Streptomyces variabilis]|uniref:Uncharacterized protein n=1 Tax=Streptomyces variabilis TaxID=67372 RepID=A0ABQ2TSU6_9ACTN|nr:hypothetical protein [Streptomyces variabilis]GGP43279.1 hypothetical protein GCM10010265_21230 [Streptomyces griseoincarnatus]GGT32530.1 hypothetical protein GCM10010287_00780 [Streptomyces variabilis]